MPWPIPKLITIQRPNPISLRKWLPAVVAVAAGCAVAVLKLWPSGKSTQTALFWGLLIGAPTAAVCLLFGWRLNRWEQEQLIAEESQHEKKRIETLWRNWCRRNLPIAEVAVFLPQKVDAAKLGDADAELPVNTNRSAGFDWTKDKPVEQRRKDLLGFIVTRLRDGLSGLHEIALTLILDEASFADQATWEAETKEAFEQALKGVDFNVEAVLATDCAKWIAGHIDVDGLPARLVVAIQSWRGEEEQVFSEAAAAILFASRPAGFAREGALSAPVVGHVLRPVTTGEETLKDDLSQIVAMQVAPDKLTHVWLTGCSEAFGTATLTALNSPENKVIDRLVDSIIGLPGPLRGWIALSIALEMGKSLPGPQLVVWRDAGRNSTQMCVVASGEMDEN
ncbi:hypothetical protein [Paraburkholderia strydomiana]|jgi:hypothetical protein|uniref:hypothetical protein n=1 Tax=Paraburkholderia strydomiana TaxID=1245417 RepID=UPI0038BD869C